MLLHFFLQAVFSTAASHPSSQLATPSPSSARKGRGEKEKRAPPPPLPTDKKKDGERVRYGSKGDRRWPPLDMQVIRFFFKKRPTCQPLSPLSIFFPKHSTLSGVLRCRRDFSPSLAAASARDEKPQEGEPEAGGDILLTRRSVPLRSMGEEWEVVAKACGGDVGGSRATSHSTRVRSTCPVPHHPLVIEILYLKLGDFRVTDMWVHSKENPYVSDSKSSDLS